MNPLKWLSTLSRKGRYAYMEWTVFYRLSRQIRAMRKQRGWTQQELAEKSGLQVQTISRIERWIGCRCTTITTLTKVANAFDCAFESRFASWSEWAYIYATPDQGYINNGLRPEALCVPSFEKEMQELSKKEHP